ncbi:sensor histidine kinase [Sabulicella glaciei]|uniref:histidine kinase n=1 Tax=Sabulicella glaciei TaxID=2984948 RepID=A0ABT3NV47_9PROT|nr:HWE histidine kinase domain-containing protein [Roseococcus sp. MDT2-1-1]MCW8086029.1 PAS domain-containing protein [Roseococcus sp. MDT2-1-1]
MLKRLPVSFRLLLVLMALGLTVPFTVLASHAVWRAVSTEQHRFSEQLLATARALALAVDRELGQARARIDTLVLARSLASRDFDDFIEQARPTLPEGTSVTLYDSRGTMLFDTKLGRVDPRLSGAGEAVTAGLAQEGFFVSPLFIGAHSGKPFILIGRPVILGGERFLLGYVLSNSRLQDLLQAQRIPENWTSAILDNRMRVAARSRLEERFVGAEARPEIRDLLGRGEGVHPSFVSMDGQRSVVAAAPAPESGYAVVMAAPKLAPLAAASRAMAPTLLAGLALVLFGIVIAVLLGRRLVGALDRLRAGPVPGAGTGIAEVDEAARRIHFARRARDEAHEALRLSEERLRLVTEAFIGGVYECLPDRDEQVRSPGVAALVGEASDEPGREWWRSRIHPADRERWLAARSALERGEAESFEARYRVRHAAGHWVHVWHRSLALRGKDGRVERLVGSVLDVSAEAEERRRAELLAREMDHRVKNSFALVTGLVAASAHRHPEAEGLAQELRERLNALSVAHDLSRGGGYAATVRGLLKRLAKPHGDAVVVLGLDATLPADQVQPLALVVHEWLTNALKHGALSRPGGRILLDLSVPGGTITLSWREQGGPPVSPPAERGFGSELVDATVVAQLGGCVEEEWAPDGLRRVLRWPGEATPTGTAPLALLRQA